MRDAANAVELSIDKTATTSSSGSSNEGSLPAGQRRGAHPQPDNQESDWRHRPRQDRDCAHDRSDYRLEQPAQRRGEGDMIFAGITCATVDGDRRDAGSVGTLIGNEVKEYSFVIKQADGTQYEMRLDNDLVLEAGKVHQVNQTLQIGN